MDLAHSSSCGSLTAMEAIKVEPSDPDYEAVEIPLQTELDLEPEVKVELEVDPGSYQPPDFECHLTDWVLPVHYTAGYKMEESLSNEQDNSLMSESGSDTSENHLFSNKESDQDLDYVDSYLKLDKTQMKARGDPKKWKELFKYPSETMENVEIIIMNDEEMKIEFEKSLKELRETNTHVCDHCILEFGTNKLLECHRERMHSEQAGKYLCDICLCRLKTDEILKKHRRRHYTRYRCKVCHVTYAHNERAMCHVTEVHLGKAFTCPHADCSKQFRRPYDLQRHLNRHPRNLYQCPLCSVTFKHESKLKTHYARKHSSNTLVTLPCPHCERTFTTARELVKHRNKEHPWSLRTEEKFACQLCDRVFSSRGFLNGHIRRMHSGRIKRFECDYCHKLYYTKPELRAHIQWSHMRARGGVACACGRVFRAEGRLRQHVLSAHGGRPHEKRHKCPQCGKAFETNYLLKRHSKRHDNSTTYPCPECDMRFKEKTYVPVHYKLKHLNMTREQIKAEKTKRRPITVEDCSQLNKKITVEEVQAMTGIPDLNVPVHFKGRRKMLSVAGETVTRDFPCEQCGKVFKTNALLRRHTKSHTDVTYPCPDCDMRFKDERYVQVHHKIKHLKMSRAELRKGKSVTSDTEKRHTCEQCGKAFLTKFQLKRHAKTHTDTKYPCSECGAQLRDQYYVKKHHKIKHPNIPWDQFAARNKTAIGNEDKDETETGEGTKVHNTSDCEQAVGIDSEKMAPESDRTEERGETSQEGKGRKKRKKVKMAGKSKKIKKKNFQVSVPLFDTFREFIGDS